jgi:membrane associated rhomboid family serine protease
MIIPIGHDNMSARRWPVVTLSLIAINILVFLATYSSMQEDAPQLGEVKAHILLLAATHPELNLPAPAEQVVTGFKRTNPELWSEIQQPNREISDGWDAQMRLQDKPAQSQADMDSLSAQYAQLSKASIVERYAFVPAHPSVISYVSANFLHGGWLHLIGNMWFLWLAGFVLEDTWGRPLYTVVYFIAGAAALQFHAWFNAGSTVPTLGASGAVAALMGAFLVRFPAMRIELAWMLWIVRIRLYRFKVPAYALLPFWLLMEVFSGSLSGQSSGVAHWAHVGGFLFGAVAALALRYSGLEQQANQAIEEKVSWTAEPALDQANELLEKGQLEEAVALLADHTAAKPDSLDAWSLLRHAYWQRQDIPAYQQATIQLCDLHLKAKEYDPAWKDYEEFLQSGGETMPPATWFNLCKAAEQLQCFDRAAGEYEKLAAAHPKERESLLAQVAAARLCMKQLHRPEEALRLYQAAAASPVPHLDWEQTIVAGIRDAKAATSRSQAAAAGR